MEEKETKREENSVLKKEEKQRKHIYMSHNNIKRMREIKKNSLPHLPSAAPGTMERKFVAEAMYICGISAGWDIAGLALRQYSWSNCVAGIPLNLQSRR
jgi:hypothetical protein